jgi:hypothetical protein
MAYPACCGSLGDCEAEIAVSQCADDSERPSGDRCERHGYPEQHRQAQNRDRPCSLPIAYGVQLRQPMLVATAISTTRINLTWTDNSTNETKFRSAAQNRSSRNVGDDRLASRQC